MEVRIAARLVAVVTAAASLIAVVGAPAHADAVDDVQRGTITSYQIRLGGTDLVTGLSVEHTASTPATAGGAFYLGEGTPGELDDVVDVTKKCSPGGWDIWTWIDATNVFGEVLWRFHVDTEFYYDCKTVTRIPFVTVYGSDYSYFWQWDKTIANQKAGIGTKVGTAVGAGGFKQCENFKIGEFCTAHDSAKITIHVYADGSFDAVGH